MRVGDSMYEADAADHVAAIMKKAAAKGVKIHFPTGKAHCGLMPAYNSTGSVGQACQSLTLTYTMLRCHRFRHWRSCVG